MTRPLLLLIAASFYFAAAWRARVRRPVLHVIQPRIGHDLRAALTLAVWFVLMLCAAFLNPEGS